MSVMPFDTSEYIEELKTSGIPDEQAKVQIKLLARALQSEDIATKWDIKALEASTKQDIKALEASTTIELEKIRGEIKALEASTTIEIKALDASTKVSISEAKTETIKWIAGILVAQAGFIIAAIKLL